jgi:hypothetical protein
MDLPGDCINSGEIISKGEKFVETSWRRYFSLPAPFFRKDMMIAARLCDLWMLPGLPYLRNCRAATN